VAFPRFSLLPFLFVFRVDKAAKANNAKGKQRDKLGRRWGKWRKREGWLVGGHLWVDGKGNLF